MINEQYGVMMYGPQRWAAIKAANGQQLGWSWGGIWDGVKSIGNWGIKTFIKSEQTGAYKAVAAAAGTQQQQTKQNLPQTGSSILPILGIAAAAALAFMG